MIFIKMKVSVKKVTDNVPKFLKAQKEMRSNQVLVGIPSAKAPRTPDEKEKVKEQPINNAALGYIHNYGMPAQNIPARPFMEPGIKDAKGPISNYMGAAAAAALKGNAEGLKKNLIAAGIVAATEIKKKINTGPFVALKPATIAARKRRGRTGTKPLIDTAQLRNAITFVVRSK
jgi:phage gpG-like protein